MQDKIIKKFMNPKITAVCSSIFLFLGSCSSLSGLSLAETRQSFAQEASFWAMGTRWTLSVEGNFKEEEFVTLKERVTGLALLYDTTFSDWSSASELRKLELQGLGGRSHQVTELFMEGLLLSQEAFEQSQGAFDLTTGAQLWAQKTKAVGQDKMILNRERLTLSFSQDPIRLSFGGIAKGMALGEIAAFLVSRKANGFWVDAGGGNRVRYENSKVVFESFSRAFKANSSHEVHIFAPSGAKLLAESAKVVCQSPSLKRSDLLRWGALSDAFSTAKLVSQKWDLPQECYLVE